MRLLWLFLSHTFPKKNLSHIKRRVNNNKKRLHNGQTKVKPFFRETSPLLFCRYLFKKKNEFLKKNRKKMKKKSRYTCFLAHAVYWLIDRRETAVFPCSFYKQFDTHFCLQIFIIVTKPWLISFHFISFIFLGKDLFAYNHQIYLPCSSFLLMLCHINRFCILFKCPVHHNSVSEIHTLNRHMFW